MIDTGTSSEGNYLTLLFIAESFLTAKTDPRS